MADIVIRGMEIPKNCSSCKIICWNYLKYGINGLLAKLSTSESRDPNCPLIPLPAGHGRLIDADALLEQIRDGFEKAEQWRDAVENDPEIRPRAEATVVAFWECGAKVKMAPTIIEAEGGGEK